MFFIPDFFLVLANCVCFIFHPYIVLYESEFEFDHVSDFYVESEFEFESGSDFLGVVPLDVDFCLA